MILVVDENIPAAAATFGQYGGVRCLPGRSIDAAVVRDADVLIVRSVTRVDAALLRGSRVRFVGTTTAGVDHVREDELAQLGIRFAHAPGSNADSVVDYVLSALALHFPDTAQAAGRSVGIIGCGQVGGRLLRRLRGLGFACRVFDPLIARDAEQELCGFADVLDCDAVTLHVPLVATTPHPTLHMIGAAELGRLPQGALLINTARGAVVDNAALLELLKARGDLRVVLDVWESEPAIPPDLLERVWIGTPHIAGYAFDGKLRGVVQVYEILREFLGSGLAVAEIAALQTPVAGTLDMNGFPETEAWQRAVLACYDLREDAARLRETVRAKPMHIAPEFDRLRRDYPQRRELSAWHIDACDAVVGNCHAPLRSVGFRFPASANLIK